MNRPLVAGRNVDEGNEVHTQLLSPKPKSNSKIKHQHCRSLNMRVVKIGHVRQAGRQVGVDDSAVVHSVLYADSNGQDNPNSIKVGKNRSRRMGSTRRVTP